ncbi:MAG: protein phosphatase 2C domain-containing protein, partial [Gammaproteobacteria bacterium]|nr:protein phosphatase 2C domain-containing protein [Gammaproteobacteria bacterium]
MAINCDQLEPGKDSKDRTPVLYIAEDMEAAADWQFGFGGIAAFSRSSPEKTTGNEDSAALIPIDPESGVLVVADGVGGMPTGGVASRITVETLTANLLNFRSDQTLRDAILDSIEQANRAVLERGSGAATTVVVIEIQGNSIRPYHVGDSLILLTGQHGRLKLQNIPHSPTGYAVEAGLLDESDAIHHEERNLVSNVVGDSEMRIEIGPSIKLAPRDTLVL